MLLYTNVGDIFYYMVDFPTILVISMPLHGRYLTNSKWTQRSLALPLKVTFLNLIEISESPHKTRRRIFKHLLQLLVFEVFVGRTVKNTVIALVCAAKN